MRLVKFAVPRYVVDFPPAKLLIFVLGMLLLLLPVAPLLLLLGYVALLALLTPALISQLQPDAVTTV